MMRTLDVLKGLSGDARRYLAAGGRLLFATWSAIFQGKPVDGFFPGLAVLARLGAARADAAVAGG